MAPGRNPGCPSLFKSACTGSERQISRPRFIQSSFFSILQKSSGEFSLDTQPRSQKLLGLPNGLHQASSPLSQKFLRGIINRRCPAALGQGDPPPGGAGRLDRGESGAGLRPGIRGIRPHLLAIALANSLECTYVRGGAGLRTTLIDCSVSHF